MDPHPTSPSRILASVFVGTSLDGYLARPDGTLDFLPEGGGEPHGYEEFFASIDAVVIGRKTYETVLTFGDWPYGQKAVFVLSHRPVTPPPSGAILEQLSGDPAELMKALAARGVRSVYVDGGETIQAFLRAGLIQRLVITRVPVLIGEGIPLFGRLPADVKLHHVATRTFASGLVQSEYRVADISMPDPRPEEEKV